MRRIESHLDYMNGVVTYELDDGQRVRLEEWAVREYGPAEILRFAGHNVEASDNRLPVMQGGRKVGTLPASFDPMFAKSKSFLYDFRPGDFKRDGDVWIANRMLGHGDLAAVPGFVWDREP